MNHQPINRPRGRGFGRGRWPRGFGSRRSHVSGSTRSPVYGYRARPVVVYLVALAVPVIIALSAIGSSPYLLEKVVPEQYRASVAALGRQDPGPADDGGSPGAIATDQHPVAGGPVPSPEGWDQRRPEDYAPPAGLVDGVNFSVMTSDDGSVAHWPCAAQIPVHSFDAPPGSEADLAWSVETLAFASGLPLRYAGHGAPEQKDAEGGISVTYGHHPDFHHSDVAGIGGPTIWTGGLITQGMVILRPDQISPTPGDPWTRSLTLHELMHAIGINHAAEHSGEIMATRPEQRPQTVFGHGDNFALHMVGCP